MYLTNCVYPRQLIHPSVSQSVSETVSESVSESVKESVIEPMDQKRSCQLNSHSVSHCDQSVNQFVSESAN